MKDYKHLDREGLMKVLGEGDEPKAGILWRGLEKVVATLGFLLLCFVVLWAMGAWFGFWWQALDLGWGVGKAFFYWLFELPWRTS